MAPLIAGFVKLLLANGLPLVANAALAKGQEWVEEKTGVKVSDTLDSPDLDKLREFNQKNSLELGQIALENNKLASSLAVSESEGVTKRWAADMASDSRLSKCIRPMTLAWLLAAWTLCAVLSAYGKQVDQIFVNVLSDWGGIIIGAYFGARTIEKAVQMIWGKK
jgi:hypothetical protein